MGTTIQGIDQYENELRQLVLSLYPAMLQSYPDINLSARIALTIQTADEMLAKLHEAYEREQKRIAAYNQLAEMTKKPYSDHELLT